MLKAMFIFRVIRKVLKNFVNNVMLKPLGLQLVRVPQNPQNFLGTVVQCLVSDQEYIEHVKLRSKTVTKECAQDLEKFFFEGENYKNYEKALKPLEDFLKSVSLPQNFTFLDVGCAVGQLVPFLYKMGIPLKYVGMDIAFPLVSSSYQRFKRYKFVQGDATCMPFPDSYFDVVYSRSTLISTYDWKKALREHLRVARCWILLLDTPFHEGEKETIYFMQHSRIHTSLLCSFTRDAFLSQLPKVAKIEIKPCGSEFEVINFGKIKWYDVFIKL